MYNVARFLDDFFASLERQEFPFAELDVVLVDDGSTDETRAVAEKWAANHGNVTVLHKENGGQASARNLGLKHAANEWVCFVDPDDMLDPVYFSESHRFMLEETRLEAALYATNPIYLEESTGLMRDGHPLRGRFRGGNRLVDLRGYPNSIQMQATTAFFRRSVLNAHKIEFGTRIRPTFEDAHFVSQYLLRAEVPLIGIVSTAHYIYRKRADGTSTLQTSHGDARKYTDVPRYGLLDILQRAQSIQGVVPVWLQNVVLYDVFWLFKSDRSIYSTSAGLPPEVFEEFHALLDSILEYIDEDSIFAFDAMPIALWMRQALAWSRSGGARITDYALVRPLDEGQNLVKLTYRFTGALPREEFTIRGRAVQARHSKTQAHAFFGRTLLRERTLWVSAAGTVRLSLNGRAVRLAFAEPSRPDTVLLPSRISAMRASIANVVPMRYRQRVGSRKRYFFNWAKGHYDRIQRAASMANIEGIWTAWMLRSSTVKSKYGSAWVLMDRDNEANDSAEELYHWLRSNHPEINAWFVLRKDSPDWERLEAAGVKLAAYGSFPWRLLMLSAEHYASSHIDDYVVKPLDTSKYGPRRWRFTFLQHGVIKGDLSRWLNHKSLDLFITSTAAEYESIAGDDSPYRFGTKEVRLTGLPRHDSLLRKRQIAGEPDRILIAPTWRSYLVPENAAGTAAREKNADFAASAYVQHYRELLRSPGLRDAAAQRGLRISFMPHPNTQPYMDVFDIPDYVDVVRYGVHDVQQVMAETAIMVTDYSSIAFNIAYVDGAVVYFQFDREDYFGGGHTERPSYFDYEEHGFGPVSETVAGTVQAVADIAAHGGPHEEYLQRIREAFPVRDGENSRRVYEAMVEVSRRLGFKKATTPYLRDESNGLPDGRPANQRSREAIGS